MATIVIPDNYSTIKEGLNHARANDIIKVKKGTYPENLTIDKNGIFLVGEDECGVKMIGSSNDIGIIIKAKDVKISNLDICDYEFGIVITSQGSVVEKNNFRGNAESAIYINGSSSTVRFNEFSNNKIGLSLETDNGAVVSNSFFDNKFAGIYNVKNEAKKVLIAYNHIVNSNTGIGIVNVESINNKIENNIIDRCEYGTVNMGIGNLVITNKYSYCNINALQIAGNETVVVFNDITNNNNGICVTGNNNLVKKNNILSNMGTGLEVLGEENVGINNIIVSNKIGIGNINYENNEICDNYVYCNEMQKIEGSKNRNRKKKWKCDFCFNDYEFRYFL